MQGTVLEHLILSINVSEHLKAQSLAAILILAFRWRVMVTRQLPSNLNGFYLSHFKYNVTFMFNLTVALQTLGPFRTGVYILRSCDRSCDT